MADRDSRAARAYLEAPLPAASTPWREVTFSVVDWKRRAWIIPPLSHHTDFSSATPIVDTAALAVELDRRRREPPSRRQPIGLSDLARSLGLPVHRPHHADCDALTTAQVFIALATHLDGFKPQTLGSLQRMTQHPGLAGRIRRRLGRLRDVRIGSSARP